VNRKNVWVTGNRTDGYRTVTEGASRAGGIHETQRTAIAAATKTAQARGGDVIIQSTDGLIRARNSYGNDPPSSKG
jgi:hypothetical protein